MAAEIVLLVSRAFPVEHRVQAGFQNVLHGDVLRPLVPGVQPCLVEDGLQDGAGVPDHDFRNGNGVNPLHKALGLQVVGDDFDGVLPHGEPHLDGAVKPARPQQGFGEAVGVVGGGQNEHLLAFYLVNAGLYRDVLLRVGVFFVPVGELVHVVQEHDGGRVFRSLLKSGLDLLDKVSVGLVFPAAEHRPAAFLYDGAGHQGFAHPWLPVEQQPPGGGDPQLVVEFPVFQRVADLHEFLFDGHVPDDLVKRLHKNHPFVLL